MVFMKIQLVAVPYDSGRRGFRMGAGPEHLIRSGLPEALAADGHAVSAVTVESTAGDDVRSAFDLAGQIAVQVGRARARGAFPVVLAGNCMASVGGFAGLDSVTGMLWLDAHADLNTPDTSESGFLDGMALAVMTGRCWQSESAHVDGFAPLPDPELVLLGVRSVDAGEQAPLARVQVVQDAKELAAALARMQRAELYLHIDLDALDPSVLIANSYATAGGLSLETLRACIAEAHAKHISAVAFTAYDPAADALNAAPAIVLEALRAAIAP